MDQQRQYIFSEDRKSILKRAKTGEYEVVASFPEPLSQKFETVQEEERNISNTDPSFLDFEQSKRCSEEPKEPPLKRKIAQKPPAIPHLPPSPSTSSTSSESILFTPPSSRKLENLTRRPPTFSPGICGTPRPVAFSTPHQLVPTQMTSYGNSNYVYSSTPSCFLYSPHYRMFSRSSIRLPRFLENQKEQASSHQMGSELVEDPPKPPPRKASILQSEMEKGTLPKVLKRVHHVTLYDTVRNKLTRNIQSIPERIDERTVDFDKLLGPE